MSHPDAVGVFWCVGWLVLCLTAYSLGLGRPLPWLAWAAIALAPILIWGLWRVRRRG